MEACRTEQLLIDLISEETGVAESSISPATQLDSLGMDSLDFLLLMKEVCHKFKEIPEVKWARFDTVADILREIS